VSLPVTRKARRELGLDPRRFGGSGRVSIPSFASAYALAEVLGEHQEPGEDAPRPVAGEDLAALDLLEDLAEEAIDVLLEQQAPDLMDRCLRQFADRLGEQGATARWERLADELEVEHTAARHQACLRRLMAATVLRRHPLADRILGMLGLDGSADPELEDTLQRIDELLSAAGSMSPGPLEALAEGDPDSFEGVLGALSQRGGPWAEKRRQRIDSVLGLLNEARTPRLAPGHAPDPGIGLEAGPAAYSADAEWMRDLVLVAKNVLVWLRQLSERYGRSIARLDEIPSSELEELAGRGFTGLWLIGIWERSPASGALKRAQGSPAAASAYAVRRYRIAGELGGEAALEDLKRRAGECGLRLAADLVPNHTAIDSDWVIEHPERFVWCPESPFPGYRFEGDDLSPDPRVGLRVEDHYQDRTDAAVVFQRVDRQSGETRYVYHGNDGTAIPWNDTAQLDYSRAETRSAVADEIVAMAKSFPILRFDAAMTMTRHHFHRLWYPSPDVAGAIPSRAEHGLSVAEFECRMPQEFWREVVDRVAREAPGTLLLAEAFWLMEGYFVRRLGLHRVYNSAFMHMLRDGDNGHLRQLLGDTLEVDPALLGRLTNYLSTPDEETTIAQFGRGDRYFGACRLLVTLPGLPLFTHGQWEGLEERYGMEFDSPRWQESPDAEVVARHDREIAPLLARRTLFAGVEDFRLLDLLDDSGRRIDAVLAHANNTGTETVIVALNNGDAAVAGRLVPTVPPDAAGDRWAAAWPGLPAAGAGEAAGDADWELRDLTAERRVTVTPEDRQADGIRLQLAPFECTVLGLG